MQARLYKMAVREFPFKSHFITDTEVKLKEPRFFA